jgi:pyrroloquinoline quinone (PQQ) biosynthesis protein C
MEGKNFFIDALIREIIQPGIERLLQGRYFSELVEGKLSIRRLQGFALQHYLHNVALCKGFALCLVKNAHDSHLYQYFLHQLNEEQYHPDLAKRFGLALGLKEEDFQRATPIFECLAHTSAVVSGMLLSAPAENRTTALVNESMVCRYSELFDVSLRRHYGLADEACEFFTVHRIADQEHTQRAAEVIARYTESPSQQQRVREIANHAARFKLAKFEGIYQAYA